MRDITKRFGRLTVLDGARLDLYAGEVHVFAGENGAGKSTLMKILGGVYDDYDGRLEIGGRLCRFSSPLDATAAGVAMIHQELSLVGTLSIADNLFLGRNLLSRGGFVRDQEQRDAARAALRRVGLTIDIMRRVETLSIAQQQLVEIAKALALNARIIVMDEPTSALSGPDVGTLFDLIQTLRSQGVAIAYITHKMEEIERIADRVTVFRDGRFVATALAKDVAPAQLVQWMVGREVGAHEERDVDCSTRVCLDVKAFSVQLSGQSGSRAVNDVTFTVSRGEIVGVAGLQGSGASELFGGLFGAYGQRAVSGAVTIDGEPLVIRGPREAIAQGVALLTNDRKATGLVLPMSILANASLASLPRVSPGGWRRTSLEHELVADLAKSFALRSNSLHANVGSLSGGNQQKVVLAKWIATRPRLLLLDEPTRGIDIGAKREIYRLMNEWTQSGISILLITSELPELLALSDRIITLHRGRIAATFSRAEATPDRVLHAAMGSEADLPAAFAGEVRVHL